MKRDLKSFVDTSISLIPAVRTASGTGTHVDLRGYDSAMIEFGVGTLATDGTYTCQLQQFNWTAPRSAPSPRLT